MELVVDANILFAALIKDSYTSELMFNDNLKLYAPDFLVTEFMKYEDLILRKTGRSRESFIEIMHCLNAVITTIPEEEILPFFEQAKSISPDENDIMYFALALKLKCGIWSNDNRLKHQNLVKIYSTQDVHDISK
jgi:predicted nucleic acid-binding protein